jgi:serine/threonine-protein kinase
MSPEQATADRTIDGRTDIYSLGAVLYEMLAGDPPHRASTAQAILVKVLTERPQRIRALRETVPDYVEAALDRALAKLPADRFATAREFEEAITGARRLASLHVPAASDQLTLTKKAPPSAHRIRALVPWAVALAGVAVGAGAWLTRDAPRVPRSRFVLALDDSAPVAIGPGPRLALSPDGSQLAYVAEPATGARRVFVRPMNELDAKALPGTEQAIRPSFSPNGEWIAFTVANRLRKIPAAGGTAVTILDDVGTYSWGDGDAVVFVRPSGRPGSGGLWRVSANGGQPERLTVPDSSRGETHLWPHVLPGGKAAIFSVVDSLDMATATLAAVRLDGKHEVVRLEVLGVNPRYVPTGHVVLGRMDGTIVAVPFDVDRLQVTGAAVTLTEPVRVKIGGATELAVAANGTAAFVEDSRETRLVFVDRTGRERPAVDAAGVYARPRLSPDGRRLAVAKQDGDDSDIWIHDIESRTWTRLTNGGRNVFPEWTADGRRIVWLRGPRGRGEIKWQPWDGSQPARTIAAPTGVVDGALPSPTGSILVLVVFAGNPLSGDLYIAPMDSGARVRPLLVTPESEGQPSISPDGRWLAYTSTESGQRGVHLRSIAGASGRTVISTGAAGEPRWSRDGRQLFYRSGGYVLVATIDTSPPVRVIRQDTLFADRYAAESGTSYDVTADGARFLFAKPAAESEHIVVAFGWLDGLRERMATPATKR